MPAVAFYARNASYCPRVSGAAIRRIGKQCDTTDIVDGSPFIARSLALRGREGGATAELGDEVATALRASSGGSDKAHLVSVTDPNTRSATAAYDGLDRLVQLANEHGHQSNYTYGHSDLPATESDPRLITTNYVLNGWGEVIQEEGPDIGTLIYERDAAGRVVAYTDGRGIVANHSYDNGGRRLTTTFPSEPSIDVAYTYDSDIGGNAGAGRLTSVTDAAGSTDYRYDKLGRVSEETRVIDSATYVVAYQYDAADNVVQITYPSGRVVGFNRNANGNVSSVWTQENGVSPTESLVYWTSRAPFGPLMGIGRANGLTDWATFNANGDIATLSLLDGSTEVSDRTYIYQDDRNLTLIVDELDAAKTELYWYTWSGVLQNADGPWGGLTFWTDAAGNLTHRIHDDGSSVTTVQYGIPWDSNRLVSVTTNSVPTRALTSDAAGNIISDVGTTARTFAWNADGQLAQAEIGSAPVGIYRYDHVRRLVSKQPSAAGPAIHYVHDQNNNVIAEYDTSGNLYREYIWLEGNRPLAVVHHTGSSVDIYHVHTDHLQRPVRMTDDAKTTVWEATYLPHGELHSVTGPVSHDYRFPGQWFQAETGLHYNWHRHYDPTTGRYLQPDPLGTIDGHRWAYAINSPLMLTDFEGLSASRWKRVGDFIRMCAAAIGIWHSQPSGRPPIDPPAGPQIEGPQRPGPDTGPTGFPERPRHPPPRPETTDDKNRRPPPKTPPWWKGLLRAPLIVLPPGSTCPATQQCGNEL